MKRTYLGIAASLLMSVSVLTTTAAPVMAAEQQNDNGVTVSVTGEGAPAVPTGVVVSETGTYYYENGEVVTGWKTADEKTYYFDPAENGKAATGSVSIDGVYYVFQTTGVLCTGTGSKLYTIDGSQYYADKDGKALSGLRTISGSKYYFSDGGKMVTSSWKTVSGKKYYFGKNGKAVTGSVKIGGVYYVFKTSGVLCTGTANKLYTIGGSKYYAAKNGKALSGLRTISGSKYYFSDGGKMVTSSWKTVSGKKYYFGENGKALTGTQVMNGVFYVFGKNGVYDAATTKKLRAAAKQKKRMAAVEKIIGKANKVEYYGSSCAGAGEDGAMLYDNFTVYIYRENNQVYYMSVV